MAQAQYGVTPWGSWFIEVLDSYQMGERLDRGRRYANAGRVLSLDIKDGHAIAKVEGNYRPFYRVEITFSELKEKQKVFAMIEDDPALLARIAAGELPEEFLEKLRAAGIELIPKRWRDMKRSCNCPDYGDPCKHMAALYYIIAREIDADPRVLFRLRGMDLADHFGKSLAVTLPAPFIVEPAKQVKPKNLTESNSTAESSILIESMTPKEAPVFPEIPHCADLIISLLPPNPPFSERNFNLALAEFYHRASRWEAWDPADPLDPADPSDVSNRKVDVADSIDVYNSFANGNSIERRFSHSHWSIICPQPEPGAEPVLLAKDVMGKETRHPLYDAFLVFRAFSSAEGTAEYTFLFCLFKFL
ncbi:MAG: SWIM zinc finger family protein, partial [Treponema sp.]|nr:SWIM zinc finger family protein [Treponema sp.]